MSVTWLARVRRSIPRQTTNLKTSGLPAIPCHYVTNVQRSAVHTSTQTLSKYLHYYANYFTASKTLFAPSEVENVDPNYFGQREYDVTYEEFKTLLSADAVHLIDVREPAEIATDGGFPNSINIPLGDVKEALRKTNEEFEEIYGVKKPDKLDCSLVFVAGGPIKSTAAMEIAHKLGFNKARNYYGGWLEWDQKQGRSIGEEMVYYPPSYLSEKYDISFEDLKTLMSSGDIKLIDVREERELVDQGVYPGAINIPIGDLKEALLMSAEQFRERYDTGKPLRHDANLVFVGLGPIKSSAALELAHKLGYTKSRHFGGGWEVWSVRHRGPS